MTLSTDPFALVVDDDPIILLDACSILADAGFRFYEASSGDKAKDLLDRVADNVVLLFSDVEMPGETNGFALAQYVADQWPWIEIVIASGRVLPEAGQIPDKATFISKPFNHDMVHNHLRAILPDGKKPAPLKNAV